MSLQIYKTPIFLSGIASYLPDRIVTNDDLIQWFGSKARGSWIEHRTGIRERRWAREDQACSDLAFESASQTLRLRADLTKSVRTVILSTISGDFLTPPTSPFVQDRLGLKDVGAFDLGAACAGFTTGLHVGASIALTSLAPVLLISAEIRSKFLSPTDFGTAVLFGDGSASVYLSLDEEGGQFRLIASRLFSDGKVADLISIPSGGSRKPFQPKSEDIFLTMKSGAEVFLKAAEGMALAALQFLNELKVPLEEVAWLVPHQANLHLVKEVCRRTGISLDRAVVTVPITGNTSGASVGIALHQGIREEKFIKGQKVLLISAGGGGLAACALLEVSPN